MNRSVFHLTLPVLFGYLPLGMAFGVLFSTQLDYAWWIAPLMGVVIYAGAGQILAVSLLAAHAGLLEVFVAMLVLNARHLFYGLSLLRQFHGAGWRKPYLIFGLTDETYSLLTSRPRGPDRAHEQEIDFRITAFNQGYWVIGCALGALLGKNVAFDSTGIEFALISLFIVLTIEQLKALGQSFPIWLGAGAAAIAVMILPPAHQLIGAIAIVTAVLLLQYAKTRDTENFEGQEHG
ncbi:AzlC family ABC transporter permease [Marinobacter salinexigens]|uniref:AzlC family ABC transporter permease n=1 Tax=Marinobacter salinexigens TaxID=2919747 RepID=A0A5B0VHR0_9GAMM|nr:AzlC family ABC transporter permease [Marinobacter salinexigens]KAA1173938.1 AzlC family ABC transporter permease [Marinobacter salinexigens]